MGHNKRR